MRLVALVLALLALAGCTDGNGHRLVREPLPSRTVSSGTSSPSPSTGSASPAPTPVLASSGNQVLVGDRDRGTSVVLHRGQVLVVRLASTQWEDPSATGDSLRRQGVTRVPDLTHCPPGWGCGTTTARFIAVKTGAAHVRATRTSCGEARACIGNEGSFAIAVQVIA